MHWPGIVLSLVLLHEVAVPSMAPAKGRTPSGPVGASMALLATLQDANILPPEGTPAANRVIQIVIQFQGLFMNDTDPTVGQFLDQALASKFADRSEEAATAFRQGGWTSQVLEAVCDRYTTSSTDERARLAAPFARVNMRPEDLGWLCELYTKARAAFIQQRRDIHRIFAEHRRSMPGGKHFDRKERPHGDQGVHTHQSENGPDER
ncbi:MAG: uncharacterized protein K0S79_2632, partial [Nitrospira sp.]|nr:uncharacterized protein [Nitrospira sp.]